MLIKYHAEITKLIEKNLITKRFLPVFSYDEFFFLTDPEMFISSHYPDDPEWQLLRVPLTLEEFQKRSRNPQGFSSWD